MLNLINLPNVKSITTHTHTHPKMVHTLCKSTFPFAGFRVYYAYTVARQRSACQRLLKMYGCTFSNDLSDYMFSSAAVTCSQFSYQNLASTLSTPSHMGEFGTSYNSNTYLH